MKKHIDHIAFRVKDVKKAIKFYTNVHDFEIVQSMRFSVDKSPIQSYVLRQGDQKPYIFISQGMTKDNVVSQWVKEHGNAIHHIAYIVDNIKKEVARLKRDHGIKFTTDHIIGTHKFYQIFSVPNQETGLIHEIIERNDKNTFFNEGNTKQLVESTRAYSKGYNKHKLLHD